MRLLLRHPNYYKKNLTVFFIKYKECEFWRQKNQKK